MPPTKRTRARDNNTASGQPGGAEEDEVLRDNLLETVNASVQAARVKAEEERARLLTEAKEAAAKVTEDAKGEVEEMKRRVLEQRAALEAERAALEAERAALEAEKASMESAHTFQQSNIKLNIGGHRFETSVQTLTSLQDTYFASMFSGRFALTPGDDSSYFIDRDGTHFLPILNFLRDPTSYTAASLDMTETQRKALEVEAKFYGVFEHMMPHATQEHIGRSLVKTACLVNSKRDIQTAVAQARTLVFEMGSTTPFLNEKFQDLRWVITDRVINGSPVWAAVGDEWFMYRGVNGKMSVGNETLIAKGLAMSFIFNTEQSWVAVAPTELPSDKWVSYKSATLAPQYASAERMPNSSGELVWALVPEMRITAVHGLDDDDPTMATALRQLAALS